MAIAGSEDASAAAARYFIRDDDIGDLTDGLRFVVDLFVSLELPVSYQIIPARLTEACAEYLLALERDHPSLIEFGQHGLNHEMWVGGRHLNREFGPERTGAQQQSDIAEGFDLLRRRLAGGRPITVFTPPQHKYDRNTVLAAAAVGHRVFSAANYPSPHHQLAYALGRSMGLSSIRHHGISYSGGRRPEADILDLSISVAIDDGGAMQGGEAALAQSLSAALRRQDVVGFMLHHNVYSEPAERAALTRVARHLRGLGCGAFRTLGALADEFHAAAPATP